MMERRARVRNTEEAVSISIDTGRGRRRSRRAGQTSAQLEHILSGVAAPKALNVRLSRPSDEVAKRALLAWSYLALFYYAGYEYAASMGAYEVRRLILDPASELPETVMYTKGTATLPLEAPQPALIARFQEGLAAPVEVIALGVAWGPIVAVFPFANDIDDRPWRRVRELIEFDQLRSTAAVRMRQMYEPFEKELLGQVRITGSDGSDWTVTARLTELEVRALAAGVSARRIDPAFKGTWKPAMVVEHDLLVREGEPPA